MTQQVAVITGAGQGMGRAIALKFAEMNIHCVLLGRTASKLESVAQEIAALGQTATTIAVDLTNEAQVEQARAQIAAQHSAIDILVNCAGEAFIRPFEETSSADWAHVIAVNLTAHYLTIHALLPLLRQSANASIINLVSKVALQGYGSGVAAYTAAKTGLLGFTRALSAELAPAEIRVVPLCPGPVNTPMRRAATPDFDPRVIIEESTIANFIAYVVTLPRGTTVAETLIQSMHYD